MPGDRRVDFLLNSLSCFYGDEYDSKEIEQILQGEQVQTFLNDAACQLVRFSGASRETGLEVFNDHQKKSNNKGPELSRREVHFVKSKQGEIDEDNIRNQVMVHTFVNSPVTSLYQALHNVYAPTILSDSTWTSKIDNQTQELLSKLEQNLGYVVKSNTSKWLRYNYVF